ncbi:MAG: PEGA domain-containing protein [Deltaproteobacteria bacterium]|nr:PEGA domain-containing protein [Deltaproteobacteria bacterium]
MSRELPPEELALEAATRVARADTEAEPSAAKAAAVYARVQASLQKPPPRVHPWVWVSLPVAALLAWFALRPPPSFLLEPSAAVAQVQYLAGQANFDPSAKLQEVEVGAGEHLELSVPAGRVHLRGPARAQFSPSQVVLHSGRGVFSVAPRAEGLPPFVVRAPDGAVIVHGTVFEVQVEEGHLGPVLVERGRVEVRRGTSRTFLGRQQRSDRGAEVADQPVTLSGELEGPWWRADADLGFLQLESTPSGAAVELDGQALGATPLVVAWPAGPHRLRLRSPGHQDLESSITLQAGVHLRQAPELVPVPVAPKAEVEVEVEEPTPAARASWSKARRLLEVGRCSALEKELARLKLDTSTPRTVARLELMGAECLLRQGHKARAYERFAGLAARHPGTTSGESALFESAKLAEELGRREGALESLELYLARYPSGRFVEPARLRRCELQVNLRRFVEAERCLSEFLAQHPAAIRGNAAVLLAGDLARAQGHTRAAVGHYRRYLEQAPDGEGAELAHFRLAEGLHLLKSPEARQVMAKFLERYPNSARADDLRRWYTGAP